jgi:photosystem II stability/assembly factor-like uncharacterized protein
MKKNLLILLLIFSLFAIKSTAQSWTQLPSSVNLPNNLNSVSFLDCMHGVCGGGQTNNTTQPSIATTPNGFNWSNSVVSGTASDVVAIKYINSNTIYAVAGQGFNGYFYRSTNGGQTFSDTTFPTLGNIPYQSFFTPYGMVFLDSLNGYVGGSYYGTGACNCNSSQVLKTTDGGITWQQSFHSTFNYNEAITNIFFLNKDTGFVLNSPSDSLYKTTDGGLTWSKCYSFQPNSIYFQDADTGWAPESNGFLLKTTDGGGTWNQIPTYGSYGFTKIVFTDRSNCWLVAGNVILHNTNGATSFLSGMDTFNFINQITDICMLSNTLGYAVGVNGSIYKYTSPFDTIKLSQSICGGQLYIVGTQSYNATGNYNVNILSSGGCDSAIINLQLTVNSLPNPFISDNSGVLSAGSFTSYQWLYNGAQLTNDTLQTIIPPLVGNYSVIVTDANGCSDTSSVINITSVGIIALTKKDIIQLYPNPNTGSFILESNGNVGNEYIISDMIGKAVAQATIKTDKQPIEIKGLSIGTYFIHIKDRDSKAIKFEIEN